MRLSIFNQTMFAFAFLFGASQAFGLPQAAAGVEPSRFVIIGSGETFSFQVGLQPSFNSQTQILGRDDSKRAIYGDTYYYGTGQGTLTIEYEGKKYELPKQLANRVSSIDKEDVKKDLEEALAGLFSSETMALTFMQKDLAVVDDTAKVISDSPQVLFVPDQLGDYPDRFSFRYTLILELRGDKVVSYKFARQGLKADKE
jgi:hypothetical protein